MSTIPPSIVRVFLGTFTARDIAEPLASFDAGAPVEAARKCLTEERLAVAGVRRQGRTVGWVEAAALKQGACGDHVQDFDESAIVGDDAPLLDVLQALGRSPRVFVRFLNAVGGVITQEDVQKPAVRMWLFGIVTLIEMRFTELIAGGCPADEWVLCVSAGRLAKARFFLAERRKRNQRPRLLDCLQFSDKGQIVARMEQLRRHTVFPSRGQGEKLVRRLEQLRNTLAHAQLIETEDWNTVVELCDLVARLFGQTASPTNGVNLAIAST